jgi:nitrogen regulatory protein PII
MRPVKRVEIITDALQMRHITTLLEEIGVSGYTIFRDVVGKGGRGIQSGDELSDAFKNSYLLTACSAERAERIVEAIQPILARRGGLCLVSDAESVEH